MAGKENKEGFSSPLLYGKHSQLAGQPGGLLLANANIIQQGVTWVCLSTPDLAYLFTGLFATAVFVCSSCSLWQTESLASRVGPTNKPRNVLRQGHSASLHLVVWSPVVWWLGAFQFTNKNPQTKTTHQTPKAKVQSPQTPKPPNHINQKFEAPSSPISNPPPSGSQQPERSAGRQQRAQPPQARAGVRQVVPRGG